MTMIWVDIASHDCLLFGGTKPLSAPKLTYHQYGLATCTRGQFHTCICMCEIIHIWIYIYIYIYTHLSHQSLKWNDNHMAFKPPRCQWFKEKTLIQRVPQTGDYSDWQEIVAMCRYRFSEDIKHLPSMGSGIFVIVLPNATFRDIT